MFQPSIQALSIVAPTPFLTADSVRDRLGVAASIDDQSLSAFIASACALLDGPDGWLGRSVGAQTIEIALDELPPKLRLPYPPIVSIVSVTLDGVPLDSSTYMFDGIRTLYVTSGVTLVYFGSMCSEDRVRVRFTSGYSPASVPAPIQQAVVMAVAKMLTLSRAEAAVKQDTVVGVSSTAWDTSADFTTAFDRAAESLLGPYRVFD